MGSYISRTARVMIAIVPVVISTAALALYKFQCNLIYPSSVMDSRKFVDTPDSYDIPYEEVSLTTSDGETIKVFVMMHDPQDPDYINKTVIMLGPNSGNMGHYLPLAEIFYKRMNYNVVTLSYRGYGYSTGNPNESGIKLDCQALLDYLWDHSQISATSLILYGRSLGGAVAIYMSSLPKGRDMITGVVLENTFLSIPKLIPSVMPFLWPVTFLCNQVWPSETIMPTLSPEISMLFLSGAQDELVPPDHMKQLFELSRSEVKLFREYEKGTHNDTCVQPEYWQDVHGFISKSVKPVDLVDGDI